MHAHIKRAQPGLRTSFRDTVYWVRFIGKSFILLKTPYPRFIVLFWKSRRKSYLYCNDNGFRGNEKLIKTDLHFNYKKYDAPNLCLFLEFVAKKYDVVGVSTFLLSTVNW
jgi:hypothetical protein